MNIYPILNYARQPLGAAAIVGTISIGLGLWLQPHVNTYLQALFAAAITAMLVLFWSLSDRRRNNASQPPTRATAQGSISTQPIHVPGEEGTGRNISTLLRLDPAARRIQFDYLIAERDYQESYHQAKENMAWLAAAVYLTALTGLALIFVDKSTVDIDEPARLPLTIGIILTAILVWCFIDQNFEDRHLSARRVHDYGKSLLQFQELIGFLPLSDDRPRRRIDFYYASPVLVILVWSVAIIALLWK